MPKNIKKFLTIDDLYDFYAKNSTQNVHFSAENEKKEIRVQVYGSLKFGESDKNKEGLLPVHLKACHTGRNLNRSKIEYENMEAALPSFAGRPILGYIWVDDEGEPHFYSHNMHEDENGETVYDEIPVGHTLDSGEVTLEYDEEEDKYYVNVDGYIYEEYTKAADILRREEEEGNEVNVSVELAFREVSFDAKEKVLNIIDFYDAAITILGYEPETMEKVMPGMAKSKITIADFQENSMIEDKLVDALNKLNENLSKFNIENQRKEESVMNHFEELLQKYNVTAEDIDFEYEGLSDEELDAAFAKKFDSEPSDPEPKNDGEEGAEGGEGEENSDVEPTSDGEYALILPTGEKKAFSLSMDEKYAAISNLVNATYGEADNDYYAVDIYDDDSLVVMYSWWTGNSFRQKYQREGDEFSLVGDREAVHRIWVTDDEEKALNETKANYEAASEKLSKYEAEPSKMEIFASDEWNLISETDEFKALMEQEAHFDLSNDEITEKLNGMLLNAVKTGKFSQETKPAEFTENKPIVTEEPVKRGRYGGFSK